MNLIDQQNIQRAIETAVKNTQNTGGMLDSPEVALATVSPNPLWEALKLAFQTTVGVAVIIFIIGVLFYRPELNRTISEGWKDLFFAGWGSVKSAWIFESIVAVIFFFVGWNLGSQKRDLIAEKRKSFGR